MSPIQLRRHFSNQVYTQPTMSRYCRVVYDRRIESLNRRYFLYKRKVVGLPDLGATCMTPLPITVGRARIPNTLQQLEHGSEAAVSSPAVLNVSFRVLGAS
jgi:hypothetical protein